MYDIRQRMDPRGADADRWIFWLWAAGPRGGTDHRMRRQRLISRLVVCRM